MTGAASKSSFILELIDKLTAPMRMMDKASAAFLQTEKMVTTEAAQMGAAVAKAGSAVERAGAQAARGAAGFTKAAAAMKAAAQSASYAQLGGRGPGGMLSAGALGAMTRRGAPGNVMGPLYDRSAQGAAAGGMGPILDRKAQGLGMGTHLKYAANDLMKWNKGMGESIDKWKDLSSVFMKTPFGMVIGGLSSIGSALLDIVGAIASAVFSAAKLAVALGAVAAVVFTKQVLEMAGFAEQSKKALGFITGSKMQGNKEFESAVALSEKLGISVEDTVKHYSKLRSMQFSAIEAKGLVKLSTDLKAITGDAQSAERALTAMTQIKAKGKLQSEELVGQLAEAGVSTVLVYKELEKMLGTDRKGVLKKLQGGQIDSETGLVAITRALKVKYHVESFGTIGEDFANNTMGGLFEAIKTDLSRALLRVGEEIDTSPLVGALKFLRTNLKEAFSDGSATSFVNRMVAGLATLIPMVVEFTQGFGDGLYAIIDAMSGNGKNATGWIRDAGTELAFFFAKVITFAKNVVPPLIDAIGALLSGINVNGLMDSLNTVDFAQLGADLVVIAGALGYITHQAAKLTGGTIGAVSDVVNDPGGTALKAATFGAKLASNPVAALSGLLSDAITGMFSDDSASASQKKTPRLRESARSGNTVSIGSVTQNITSNSSDPAEVADQANSKLTGAIQSLDGAYSGAY